MVDPEKYFKSEVSFSYLIVAFKVWVAVIAVVVR